METQAQVGMLTISIRSVGLTAHKNKKAKTRNYSVQKPKQNTVWAFAFFFNIQKKDNPRMLFLQSSRFSLKIKPLL
ncbi:hypothetical protein [Acinetobacter brisouii]|uniref:hypothetical protein n=1 Tax=Acinetobacter brisouii TaxID=396323 RepID=UPI00124FA0F7|nr:hypothetical protein [Acinetobacter brisouii]